MPKRLQNGEFWELLHFGAPPGAIWRPWEGQTAEFLVVGAGFPRHRPQDPSFLGWVPGRVEKVGPRDYIIKYSVLLTLYSRRFRPLLRKGKAGGPPDR